MQSQGPFALCADALRALNKSVLDAAVLDAVLKDGPCSELAHELKRRDVRALLGPPRDRQQSPRVLRCSLAPKAEIPGAVLKAVINLNTST